MGDAADLGSGLRALVGEPIEAAELSDEIAARLARVVPFDGWCLSGLDARTRLRVFQIGGRGTERTADMARNEELMQDANKFADLAQAEIPAGILSADHPLAVSSFRLHEVLRPQGFSSELRLVLRHRRRLWGVLTLFREDPSHDFHDQDIKALCALAPLLTDIVRAFPVRALPPRGPVPGAGVILLAPDDQFVSVTDQAWAWLQLLVAGGDDQTWLTDVTRIIYEVTHACRAGYHERTAACMRTVTGRWLRVEAARFTDCGADTVVVLHSATAHQVIDPIAARQGWTPRERQCVELIFHGQSTRQAARELGISTQTVSAHLSSVYRKSRVSSRDELFARLT